METPKGIPGSTPIQKSHEQLSFEEVQDRLFLAGKKVPASIDELNQMVEAKRLADAQDRAFLAGEPIPSSLYDKSSEIIKNMREQPDYDFMVSPPAQDDNLSPERLRYATDSIKEKGPVAKALATSGVTSEKDLAVKGKSILNQFDYKKPTTIGPREEGKERTYYIRPEEESESKAKRLSKSVMSGVSAGLQGLARSTEIAAKNTAIGAEWIFTDLKQGERPQYADGGMVGKAAKYLADSMNDVVKYWAVENPTFMEKLSSAFGTQAPMLLTGMMAGRVLPVALARMGLTTGMSPAAVKSLSNFGGAAVSAGMESGVDSASIYDELIKMGTPEAQARSIATSAMGVEFLPTLLADKLLLFGAGSVPLKAASGIMASSVQEGLAGLIQNVAVGVDRPLNTVGEQALIGGIVAAPFSFSSAAAERVQADMDKTAGSSPLSVNQAIPEPSVEALEQAGPVVAPAEDAGTTIPTEPDRAPSVLAPVVEPATPIAEPAAPVEEAPPVTMAEPADAVKSASKPVKPRPAKKAKPVKPVKPPAPPAALVEKPKPVKTIAAKPKPVKTTPPAPVKPEFSLPDELSKSAPRYRSFKLSFSNPLDKAAYILFNDGKGKRSKAAAKFDAAVTAAGLKMEDVVKHGAAVKEFVKNIGAISAGKEVIVVPSIDWGGKKKPAGTMEMSMLPQEEGTATGAPTNQVEQTVAEKRADIAEKMTERAKRIVASPEFQRAPLETIGKIQRDDSPREILEKVIAGNLMQSGIAMTELPIQVELTIDILNALNDKFLPWSANIRKAALTVRQIVNKSKKDGIVLGTASLSRTGPGKANQRPQKATITINPDPLKDGAEEVLRGPTAAQTLTHELGHVLSVMSQTAKNRQFTFNTKASVLGNIIAFHNFSRQMVHFTDSAGKKVMLPADMSIPINPAIQELDLFEVRHMANGRAQKLMAGVTEEQAKNEGFKSKQDMLARRTHEISQDIIDAARKPLLDKVRKVNLDASRYAKKAVGKQIEGITEEQAAERGWTVKEMQTALFNAARDEYLTANGYVSMMEVYSELRDAVKEWNPRLADLSNPELWAEGVSMFIQNPKFLKKAAPAFFDLFINYMNVRPDFKKAYLWLMEYLGNFSPQARISEMHIRMINQQFRAMLDRNAAERSQEMQRATMWKRDGFSHLIYRPWPYVTLAREREVGEEKKYSLLDKLSKAASVSSVEANFIHSIRTDVLPLVEKAGVKEYNFGMKMLYDRIIKGDAQDKAAPGGFTPQSAAIALEENIMRHLTDEQKAALAEAEAKFRSIWEEKILKPMKEMLGDDVFNKLMENKHYATFSLLDKVAQNISEGKRDGAGGTGIYSYVGSFGAVENPLLATVRTGLGLIYNATKNTAVKESVGFLKSLEQTPGEFIQPAKMAGPNKFASPPEGFSSIFYYDKGKRIVFYIKNRYYAALTTNSAEMPQMMQFIRLFNKWFGSNLAKSLFVNLNPGFWPWNLVRDAHTTWVNTGINPLRAMAGALKHIPATYKHLKGIASNEDVSYALENGIIASPYEQMPREISGSMERDGAGLNAILSKFRIKKMRLSQAENIMDVAEILRESIEDMGRSVDAASKIYARKRLKEMHPEWSDEKLNIIAKQRVGTPDTSSAGRVAAVYNAVLLYSHVAMMGYYANKEAYRDNKMMMLRLLVPEVLELGLKHLIATGMADVLFGGLADDEKDESKFALRQWYAGIPDHDKQAYTTIPIYPLFDSRGQSRYARIPKAELPRLFSATLWNMTKGLSDEEKERLVLDTLTEIAIGSIHSAGYVFDQMPGFSPAISSTLNTAMLASGGTPVNAFGIPIIPDAVAREGMTSPRYIKEYLWALANTYGASTIYRRRPYGSPPPEDDWIDWLKVIPLGENAVGRWVKKSSAGETQRLWEAKRRTDRMTARAANDRREEFDQHYYEFIKKNGRPPTRREINYFLISLRKDEKKRDILLDRNDKPMSIPLLRAAYYSANASLWEKAVRTGGVRERAEILFSVYMNRRSSGSSHDEAVAEMAIRGRQLSGKSAWAKFIRMARDAEEPSPIPPMPINGQSL